MTEQRITHPYTGITLFEIFREKVLHPSRDEEPLAAEVLKSFAAAAWLACGGALVGALASVTTRWLLHLAQVCMLDMLGVLAMSSQWLWLLMGNPLPCT